MYIHVRILCSAFFLCIYDIVILLSTTGSRAFRSAQFGEGTGAVFLEGLECVGTETSLLDCPMDTPLGTSLCDHSDDAGIRCYGMCVIYSVMRICIHKRLCVHN